MAGARPLPEPRLNPSRARHARGFHHRRRGHPLGETELDRRGITLFTITTEAADAIREVVEAAELPGSGGMRISTAPVSSNGSGPTLELTVAPEPGPEDEVLDDEGAQVFLDPIAAAHVDGKVLDADHEPGGGVSFSLRESG